MTLMEAIAQQPAWVGLWMNVLLVGAFILPLFLLIWRQSRKAGVITFVSSIAAGVGINLMYAQMGYVKLLGLPHILLWTPVMVFLVGQARRQDMPVWPMRIIWMVIVTLLISLIFDYADFVRYLFGNRSAAVLVA